MRDFISSILVVLPGLLAFKGGNLLWIRITRRKAFAAAKPARHGTGFPVAPPLPEERRRNTKARWKRLALSLFEQHPMPEPSQPTESSAPPTEPQTLKIPTEPPTVRMAGQASEAPTVRAREPRRPLPARRPVSAGGFQIDPLTAALALAAAVLVGVVLTALLVRGVRHASNAKEPGRAPLGTAGRNSALSLPEDAAETPSSSMDATAAGQKESTSPTQHNTSSTVPDSTAENVSEDVAAGSDKISTEGDEGESPEADQDESRKKDHADPAKDKDRRDEGDKGRQKRRAKIAREREKRLAEMEREREKRAAEREREEEKRAREDEKERH
jgi:hypothetical protein